MNRQQAYKKHPEIAAMTDFLTQHEKQLKKLHRKYKKDANSQMEFIPFVAYIYENAQDLVLNPEDN